MAVEPDMENLLASIRKAIDSDIGGHAPIASPLPSKGLLGGSISRLRAKFDGDSPNSRTDEIQELRNRINRTRAEAMNNQASLRHPPTPPISSALGESSAADRLLRPLPSEANIDAREFRVSFAEQADYDELAYDDRVARQETAAWEEGSLGYLPALADGQGYEGYLPDPLLSDTAADSAHSAFNQLADTVMARALGERTIEDMTYDLLRGMLKTWLDDNLPAMVERLVREEIERVSRRGR